MAYSNKITTSVQGRRLGLQNMSTSEHGGRLAADFLVGAEAVREGVTTGESTGTNVQSFGVSFLNGTSAASSAVYTIDPPIPGVRKTIVCGSTANGPMYLKTKNSETFWSTLATTFTVLKSSAGGALELIGLTTSIWGALGLTSGTSSNGSGWVGSTST